MKGCGNIVATDLSPVAPALSVADKPYLVPRIDAPDYFDKILDICQKEDIKAITTLIDPEISILANHREELLARHILPLCPAEWTAKLCFDKYEMFRYLSEKGVRTVLTYNSLEGLREGLEKGEVSFPVFMKPVNGSGSVGIGKVHDWEEAVAKFNDGKFTYIIQELMTGGDCDADVYVDCLSHKPVARSQRKRLRAA